MSKKSSAKSATRAASGASSKPGDPRSARGRVCGVCIAGLVSGMASGGVLARKRAKAQQGRSGGAKPDLLYRVKFDRPKHLSAAGYDALVKLEAGPLTRKELDAAMLRWKVGAKTYDVHTGALLFRTDRGPNGELYVWDLSEKKGRSAGRTRKGRSSGQEVANGILEQLGGQKFLVMTGAKNLLSFNEPGHGGLQFKLPRSGARAKLGIDAVRITLELSDTYTMDFYKGMTKVRSIGLLYSDDLRKTFTEVTGLETSLGTMGRAAGKKDPKDLVSWGVFPWTPDTSPSQGDPVPQPEGHGYVSREVNRETGRGTHWPYSRVQAVKIYWRRHLADAYATELTYGRKKP